MNNGIGFVIVLRSSVVDGICGIKYSRISSNCPNSSQLVIRRSAFFPLRFSRKFVMAGTYTNLVIEPAASILNEKSKELFNKLDLDLNYLPRNIDVLSYIYYIKDSKPYRTKIESLYQTVANEVIKIWKQTQIPIVSHGNIHGDKHIKKRLEKVLNAYKKIKRNVTTRPFSSFVMAPMPSKVRFIIAAVSSKLALNRILSMRTASAFILLIDFGIFIICGVANSESGL